MDFHRITVYRPKLTALLKKQRLAILGFLKTFHTHPLNPSTVSEMSAKLGMLVPTHLLNFGHESTIPIGWSL